MIGLPTGFLFEWIVYAFSLLLWPSTVDGWIEDYNPDPYDEIGLSDDEISAFERFAKVGGYIFLVTLAAVIVWMLVSIPFIWIVSLACISLYVALGVYVDSKRRDVEKRITQMIANT